MAEITFWYSIGSTYTYLTVMRLDAVAEAQEVTVRWQPFNVREIMVEQDNIPFAKKPVKAAYMWRDIARRAAGYGLSPRLPAPYPLPDLPLANRVAVLGAQDGWGRAYTIEAYRRWFEEGEPAGSEPNLSASLRRAGADVAAVLARAEGDEGAAALADATARARAAGVFGAPTFTVGDEVFWGDDRLDDALCWARSGRVMA